MTGSTAHHPNSHTTSPTLSSDFKCQGLDDKDFIKKHNTWECFHPGTTFHGGSSIFNYTVKPGNDAHFFAFGIGPLCIFCAAIFALFWGALAGVMIRRVNMQDYEGVQQCIEKYKKSEETIKKAGLKPQAPVQEVMDTLNKVGVRITNVSIFKFQYVSRVKDDVDLFPFNNSLNF